MSFGQGPTNLMKSLAVWRASRRGPGRGTGRAEDVGIVDGTGGDHRALQAYADGSGPPRGPRRGRWGWGGGGDGGGDGDGHEKFWVGSNVAAVGAMQYFSFRRSRYGSYGGGGRRGYYGRQTYRRRDRRGEGNITMTQAVTALNMIVFLLQMRFPSITSAGWKLASAISQRGQWYRLLTPVVLHGSLMHLVINTMSLNSVGPVVEKVMGKAKFVVIYVLAGMSGNVLSCLVNPRMPAVGASGAIFGMVGAWGAFCIMNQSAMGAENAQRSLAAVGQTLAFNLFLGMSSSQIDNMGHLGGFLGGAIATFFIGPRLKSFACTEGGLEECNGGFRAKAALYRGFPIAVLLATGGLLAGEACAVKTASS